MLFHAENCFYTVFFKHRYLYTELLLHTENSYADMRFYTQKPLRMDAFTHQCLYVQSL